jgi:hypothetical protein
MYSGDVGWEWVVPADVLGEGLWDVLKDHVEFAALFFRLLMYPQQPTYQYPILNDARMAQRLQYGNLPDRSHRHALLLLIDLHLFEGHYCVGGCVLRLVDRSIGSLADFAQLAVAGLRSLMLHFEDYRLGFSR